MRRSATTNRAPISPTIPWEADNHPSHATCAIALDKKPGGSGESRPLARIVQQEVRTGKSHPESFSSCSSANKPVLIAQPERFRCSGPSEVPSWSNFYGRLISIFPHKNKITISVLECTA